MGLILIRIFFIAIIIMFLRILFRYIATIIVRREYKQKYNNFDMLMENEYNNIVGYNEIYYNIKFWPKLNHEEKVCFLKGYIWAFLFANNLVVKETPTAEELKLISLLVLMTQLSYKRINEYINVLNIKAEKNENLTQAIAIALLTYHADKNLLDKFIIYEDKDFLSNLIKEKPVDMWENLKSNEQKALLNGYLAFFEIYEFYFKNEELVNLILTGEKNKYTFEPLVVERIIGQTNKIKANIELNKLQNLISGLYKEEEFANTTFEILIMLLCEAKVSQLDDEALNYIKILNNFKFHHSHTELKH